MTSCAKCGTREAPRDGRCPRCNTQAVDPDFLTLLQFDEAQSAPPENVPGVDVATRLEFASVPGSADPLMHVLVDLTASAPAKAAVKSGPVAHVILALDLSASMNHPDKYPVLTEALSGMLHDLRSPGAAEVLVSVVIFAHGAETLFRDLPASQLVPRDVLAKIDGSKHRFGRYTDVVGALSRAGRIAHDQLKRNKSMPTRIYLLTDGKPQDMAGSRTMMSRVARLPVDVDALAFGNDADVGLLQELVSGGRGGTVKHVRTETLGDAFDRIAHVAQRIVSNRATISFELEPGVLGNAAYRYRPGRHRFGEMPFEGGAKFSADLGTLETGRTYSFLFEVRLPESDKGGTDVGRVTVRLPGFGPAGTFEAAVVVPRSQGGMLPEPDGEVVAAKDVLAALSGADPKTQLRALRIRRKLYIAERRDPHVIGVIDKAIAALESEGSLAALSAAEWATLRAHTCTAGGAAPDARREVRAG